jgi:hypothetical protein
MSSLSQNISVLRASSHNLASAIETAPLPEGFTRVTGSDGTLTYHRRLTAPDGQRRVEWLGATSMPRASAEAIVGSLNAISNGANGLGLSIGSGFEWAAFTQKLGRAQMVFVYEPDIAFLRMALEICDLSQFLAQRRIVLLAGSPEEAARQLSSFLDEHLGFEPPTVLHPLPSLPAPRRNSLISSGESIVRHAAAARQACVTPLPRRIATALQQRSSGHEEASTIAFLISPRYAAERPVQSEARKRNAQCIFIDRHDAASSALRLVVLADELERRRTGQGSAANVRILSDLFRVQLATVPPEIPVETWVPPLIGPAYWDRVSPADSFAPHDRIVVHFGTHLEQLRARGISRDLIELRPIVPAPGAAPIVRPELALRHRVAMIADLPASDAASLGIELPTHQAVFAAACDLVRADYLTLHPGMAPDLLRRTLTRAGVDPQTQDVALKEPMLRIIREVLIPSLPPLALAETLVNQGIALTLIGHWPGLEQRIKGNESAHHARIVPFEDYTRAQWHDVAVLAHLSPSGTVSPLLWDAIAAEVTAVAPDHPSDRHPGSLATLLAPESQYARSSPQQFVASLKSLLRDSTRRQKLSAAALRALQ